MVHTASQPRTADITKFFSIYAISLLALVLFFGCDNGVDPPDPVVPDEIEGAVWPLEVGNEWTFDVQAVDDSSGDLYYYGERYIVDSAFLYNGKRVTRVILEYFVGDTTFQSFTLWWGNTLDGLFEYAPFGNAFVPFESSRMLFKYPAGDGEMFQSYAPNPANPVEMGFISEMPSVSLPAGSFDNCVGYQFYEPPGVNIYYYFVPDTGYVQMEKYIGSSLDKARYLRDFVIN